MAGSGMISRFALRAGLAGVCGLGLCVAQAADFIVDEIAVDEIDADLNDGVCLTANNACTLRAAVMQANASVGVIDTITLPVGDISLTIAGVDERCDGDMPCSGDGTEGNPYLPVITADASIGDLDITDDLTITGAGIEETAIGWVTRPTGGNCPWRIRIR